jgi:hypothetical protein
VDEIFAEIEDPEKDCCPTCGKLFLVVRVGPNYCIRCKETCLDNQMIGPDDDYAWCI